MTWKSRLKGFIIFSICLVFWLPAWSEYYRYKDRNGVVHFTDNLSDVPVDQRVDTNRFKEIKSTPAFTDSQEPDLSDIDAEEEKQLKDELETLSEIDTLNREREILEAEYEKLVRKKQTLRKQKKSVETGNDISDYREKLIILNKEIKAFEKRRSEFETKVNLFNKGSSD
jgi:hypothetical protein